MKKTYIIFTLFLFSLSVLAQVPDTLALWNFKQCDTYASSTRLTDASSNPIKPTPNVFNALNSQDYVYTEGATNRTVLNGQTGYVFITNWQLTTPADIYWLINGINTTGYFNLNISFSASSSASAPRDFKFQYQIGSSGVWTDMPNAPVMLSGAWASLSFAIPAECAGLPSVNFRLIRTSLYRSDNTGLMNSSGGQVKLDAITVTGFKEATVPTLFSSQNEIVFCDANVGLDATQTITVIGQKLSSQTVTLSASSPFSVSSTSINPMNGEFTRAITVTFHPTLDATYNEQLIISGGGAPTQIISLRGNGIKNTNTAVEKVVNDPVKVIGSKGFVKILSEEADRASVYNIMGQLVKTQTVFKGENSISMKPGIYILKIGKNTGKVLVD